MTLLLYITCGIYDKHSVVIRLPNVVALQLNHCAFASRKNVYTPIMKHIES